MRQQGWQQVGKIALMGVVLAGLLGCWRTVENSSAVANPMPTIPQPRLTNQRSPQPNVTTKNVAQTVNPKLVDANTRFGFKLYSEILKQEQGKNVFVSPSSLAIALAMTYNGANGETKQAMAKTLELQGMSLTELNQANADLKSLLENPDKAVQLAIANSLWARQGIAFKPDFVQRNQKYYKAQVTDLDFRDPQAVPTINNWVQQNTRGKIDSIVDRIDPDDVLFLINAIYFKGDWTQKFDKAATANKPFKLANGQQKQHPMMTQTGEYRYYETEQFQAVSLPYGGRRVSMYVFLPKPNANLTQFHQKLTTENWQNWMRQFSNRPGSIALPRFKLEYDVELSRALSALGMDVAFSRRANFGGISTEPTQIDEVKHKTFVEVNEEGTEAAAVTSIGIRATSAIEPQPPFQMVVDRPFFCVIRDNQTGSVLFMGSIVDPK
jgi:serpin B